MYIYIYIYIYTDTYIWRWANKSLPFACVFPRAHAEKKNPGSCPRQYKLKSIGEQKRCTEYRAVSCYNNQIFSGYFRTAFRIHTHRRVLKGESRSQYLPELEITGPKGPTNTKRHAETKIPINAKTPGNMTVP